MVKFVRRSVWELVKFENRNWPSRVQKCIFENSFFVLISECMRSTYRTTKTNIRVITVTVKNYSGGSSVNLSGSFYAIRTCQMMQFVELVGHGNLNYWDDSTRLIGQCNLIKSDTTIKLIGCGNLNSLDNATWSHRLTRWMVNRINGSTISVLDCGIDQSLNRLIVG